MSRASGRPRSFTATGGTADGSEMGESGAGSGGTVPSLAGGATGSSSEVEADRPQVTSLPRLEGLTFEAFSFKRDRVNVQMSMFFRREGDDKSIHYRSLKFAVLRNDPYETGARIADELVQAEFVHPDDEDAVAQWLDMSVVPLQHLPQVFTRDMLRSPLRSPTTLPMTGGGDPAPPRGAAT